MDFNCIIENYRDEIVNTIQEFIKIKSVEESPQEGKPFGQGPYDALIFALNTGEKLGFKSENFDGYAGHVEYGNGEEIVGILAHVDVVPEGEGWSYPPYGGDIHDGKIYGRGSYDDKGGCIAALYALKALKDMKFMPKRTIRLIFGANEETGMNDIPYYLSKNKEPNLAFSPDAPFPVVYGEKGILDLTLVKRINDINEYCSIMSLQAGDMPKKIPGTCSITIKLTGEERSTFLKKASLYGKKESFKFDEKDEEIQVIAIGKAAYAMSPENSINAISLMMEFLDYMKLPDSGLKVFVDFYNAKIGYDVYGEGMGCAFKDDISTPLTLCPTMISYNGNEIKVHLHIRYPVTVELQDIMEAIENSTDEYDVEARIERHSRAHYIPKESFLVKTLMNIYIEETGDYKAKPITMEGGTYARTLKNAVAFGPLFPGEKQVAHDVDEYVNIESIIKATKIYARVLYELSK